MTHPCSTYLRYCFKDFLKSLTPNDANESLFGSYSIIEKKKKQLQIMDTAHANVTAVTNNQ